MILQAYQVIMDFVSRSFGMDKVDPNEVAKGFNRLFQRIRRLGILNKYRFWRRHFVVSVDGDVTFIITNKKVF